MKPSQYLGYYSNPEVARNTQNIANFEISVSASTQILLMFVANPVIIYGLLPRVQTADNKV